MFSTAELDRILREASVTGVQPTHLRGLCGVCQSLCTSQLLRCAVEMVHAACVFLQNNLQFTVNVDVTSYEAGTRKTHNPEGQAYPHVVWGYYRVRKGRELAHRWHVHVHTQTHTTGVSRIFL